MRVAYLLDRPELGGGVKVVFQHAQLLADAGWEVVVLGRGSRPAWAPYGGPYVDVEASGLEALAPPDLAVATYWTTVEPLERWAPGRVAHFCQGVEADLAHLAASRPAIEAVYRRPLPTLAVTPPLAARLEREFGRRCRIVPPPLDPLFRPRLRLGPARRPWIAVVGIFEAEVKGIPTALAAVERLRGRGIPCRLLRVSPLPLGDGERRLPAPDRTLEGVPPARVARELRRCDLLLFPSGPAEGFGLPLLEAMAAGVPAVATRIPATDHLAPRGALRVEPGDAEAMAEAAARLLGDRRKWREQRRQGLEKAARFDAERVRPRLLAALSWAAAGRRLAEVE